MAKVICIISAVVFILWCGIRVTSHYEMKNNCTGYLGRAANANSIALAEQNLTKAIQYLERNNLTEGQVSIFLRQPKNDIGYWYENLKTAQAQLQNIDEDISSLEESNILMKLRETLTDNDSDGTTVICPDGISVYPNNAMYFWMSVISGIALVISGFLWGVKSELF